MKAIAEVLMEQSEAHLLLTHVGRGGGIHKGKVELHRGAERRPFQEIKRDEEVMRWLNVVAIKQHN